MCPVFHLPHSAILSNTFQFHKQNSEKKKKTKKPSGNAFNHLGRGIALVHADRGPLYGTKSSCAAIDPKASHCALSITITTS